MKESLKLRILDSIPMGIFAVNRERVIIYFNREAERITGIKRDEALGQRCKDVFHSNRCDNRCILKRVMSDGIDVEDRDVSIINISGDEIPLVVYGFPLLSEKGEIIGGVEVFRDISEERALRKELSGEIPLYGIVGKSEKIKDILRILPQISKSDSPVLITGETGTGKEVFARAIHSLSHRRDYPFFAINCSAIPEGLIESELFGFKEGSFTGATRDKRGIFKLADGGTLFLDEIGDLPLNVQVKILRAIEEKKILPLGSEKDEDVDVRLIAATNRDIAAMVDEGKFRADLYYRINIIEIHLPPLRERREDILPLINHFIKKFNLIKGKKIKGVSKDVLKLLLSYDFPGNVRELENIIEHGFIMCDGERIEIDHLPKRIISNSEISTLNIESIKKNTVIKALKVSNCNLIQAASLLGIHRSTLYRYISKYGIKMEKLCNKQQ